MKVPHANQHIVEWFARLKIRLAEGFRQRTASPLRPEEYRGPAPADLLSPPDGRTLAQMMGYARGQFRLAEKPKPLRAWRSTIQALITKTP